jgi:AcrR family transcriptional regulator
VVDEGRSNARTHYGPRIGRTPEGNKTEWSLRFCYSASVPSATTTRSDALRNRAKLVAAARELFAESGVEVSVEEITHHAGVGMGTLYRHFPTKDELIDAVLEDAFDEIIRLAREAAAVDDAWVGLTGFFERVLELHAQNRGVKDIVALRDHGSRRAEAMREHLLPLLAQMVTRAHEQGTLRRDFTSDDLPLVFWTANRVIELTQDVAPDFWRRYLSLLLDGLRPGAARPLPEPALTPAQLTRARGRLHR